MKKVGPNMILLPSQEDRLARKAALLRWGSLSRMPIYGHRVLLMSRRSDGESSWSLWDTYNRLLLNLRYGEEGLPVSRREKILKRDHRGKLRKWKGLPLRRLEKLELQLQPLAEILRREAEEARAWARARKEGK